MARNEMRKLMETIEAIERGEILEEGVKEWVQAAILSVALAGSPQAMGADNSAADPASIPDVITQQADKHTPPKHAQDINVFAKQSDVKNAMYPAVKSAFSDYDVYLDNGPTVTISIKKKGKAYGFVQIYPLGIDRDNYGQYAQVTFGDGTIDKGNRKFKEEEKLAQVVQSVLDNLPTPEEKEAAKTPEQRKQDAIIAAIKKNKTSFDAGDYSNLSFKVKPVVRNNEVTTRYTIFAMDGSDRILFSEMTQDDFDSVKSAIEQMLSKKAPPFDGDVPVGKFRKKFLGDNSAKSIHTTISVKDGEAYYVLSFVGEYAVNQVHKYMTKEEASEMLSMFNSVESKAQQIIDYLASEIE